MSEKVKFVLFHRNSGFSKPMKAASGIERRAAETLKAFLGSIPQLSLAHMTFVGEPGQPDTIDIIADTEFAGRPMRLKLRCRPCAPSRRQVSRV
jgi:hypothetical protein